MTERCRFRTPDVGRLLIWELSRFCNLECLHCCTASGPRVSTATDVPTSIAIECARRLARGGIVRTMLSGGEPLLRSDLVDLVAAIDTERVETYVATNGTILGTADIERLRAAGLRGFDVSLDGPTAETHAALRLQRRAFGRALIGIRACVEAGFPVRVSCALTPSTWPYIDELIVRLQDTGIKSVVIHAVRGDAGRAKEYPEIALPESMLSEVWERTREAACWLAPALDIQFRPDISSIGAGGCPGGNGVVHIAPNGDVSPCAWLYRISAERFRVGNIKDTPVDVLVNRAREPIDRFDHAADCLLPVLETADVCGV